MKKIFIGILIGIMVSFGLTTQAVFVGKDISKNIKQPSVATVQYITSQERMILVPEYIKGYKTLDLLNYLAQLKAKEDSR